MSLLTISTDGDYSSFLSSCHSSPSTLHVLLFSADWHPPCSQIISVLKEAAAEGKNAKFAMIEAENFPDITEKYPVSSVPTVVFLKNGALIDVLEGANVSELLSKITKYSTVAPSNPPTSTSSSSASSSSSSSSSTESDSDLHHRLSMLVKAGPVMLFMKGTADTPRCGFSRQLVEILKENHIRFDYFDILSDNAVREGLKKYSNWPTYPQLYVNGSLLGGLDVIKELKESGELLDQIPASNIIKEGEKGENKLITIDAKQALNQRLKSLINSHPVMLFMKGTKDAPRCGFSSRAIELLSSEGIDFSTFDILSDNAVREALKEYSNWPTYPQLYAKGKLIGGVDIMAELKEAGELKATINGDQ